MYRLIEVVISMLIMFGGNQIGKNFSDLFYEIHLKNGDILNVKINKDNNYSCPLECGAFHYHSTKINEYNLNSFSLKFDDYDNSVILNDKEVAIIYSVKAKKHKKGSGQIDKKKISLKNFIMNY